jgi:hypothetical protein
VRVLTAALTLGGSALLVSGCSKPVHHDFSGTVSIRQRPARLRGSSCTGAGANADIADGTTVVIADAGTKKVVAIATLGRGTVVTYPGSGVNFSDCRFDFRVTIPDRLQYCVKVANRTAFWRSRGEMDQDDWTIDIGLPLPPVPPYYRRAYRCPSKFATN